MHLQSMEHLVGRATAKQDVEAGRRWGRRAVHGELSAVQESHRFAEEQRSPVEAVSRLFSRLSSTTGPEQFTEQRIVDRARSPDRTAATFVVEAISSGYRRRGAEATTYLVLQSGLATTPSTRVITGLLLGLSGPYESRPRLPPLQSCRSLRI